MITLLWQSFCLETSASIVASYCQLLMPTAIVLICLHSCYWLFWLTRFLVPLMCNEHCHDFAIPCWHHMQPINTYWNIKPNQGSYLSMIVFKLWTLQIIWKGIGIGKWLVIMSTFLHCTLPPLKDIKCKTKYTYLERTTIDQGPFIKTCNFNCWLRCAQDN